MQIKVSYYRVIFFRYLLVVGLGILLAKKQKFKRIELVCMFLVGMAWIMFFYLSPAENFRYYPWENTNLFSGLYVLPIIYFMYSKWESGMIKIQWLHYVISTVGKNTYFILMTQMAWFHITGELYSAFEMPIILQILINIGISCSMGCLAGSLYNMLFSRAYHLLVK